MAPVIESLPNMQEALGFLLSTTEKEKKEGKKGEGREGGRRDGGREGERKEMIRRMGAIKEDSSTRILYPLKYTSRMNILLGSNCYHLVALSLPHSACG
jgi:hypothetical protein